MTTILLIIILLSGLYMAWNIGANDVANAMGTSVGSGALTIKQAVLIAALLEFSGAFFFGSHVSETIQEGLINSNIFASDPLIFVYGMLSALIGAGIWLQIATYYGLPVSTTHSIVGAVVGFGAILGGIEAIYWRNVAYIAFSWILSPVVGGILSYTLFNLLRKKILYVRNPLEKTKKIAPYLLFIISTPLSLFVLVEVIKRLKLSVPFVLAFFISLIIGAIAAYLGYLYNKKLNIEPVHQKPSPIYHPEVIHELDKAKKYLQRVQATSTGEIQNKVTLLAEEVRELSNHLKLSVAQAPTRTEYDLVEKIFAKFQLLSASLMAFAHGANDVANAIGPLSAAVTVLLRGEIVKNIGVPAWALALGGFGIVLGLATWGWRVIETIGKKLTELTPTRGFAAESSAAVTVLAASWLGLPVSATHTLVGAVLGVGFARGIEALNLTMTRDIVVSWLVTIPIGAAISIGVFYLLRSVLPF